jgi:hypothetical protein
MMEGQAQTRMKEFVEKMAMMEDITLSTHETFNKVISI